MADQFGLVDGAGVVVQASGDLQVGDHAPRYLRPGGVDHAGQRVQALLQHLGVHAEVAHPGDEGVVGGLDGGQFDALARHLVTQAQVGDEQFGHRGRADLVELVNSLQHRGGVFDAQSAVETFGQFAVVDMHQHRRQAEPVVQLLQRLQHDQRCLDVMVLGERVLADDVDVGLCELPVAALLGTLAAPDLLDLVAAEREVQVPGVLQHVAGQRHGQVEVQAEVIAGVLGCGMQAPDDVDLLGDLALAGQRRHRLHRSGLNAGETVQLEGLPQQVDSRLLDDALGRQELREPGQGLGTSHQASISSVR